MVQWPGAIILDLWSRPIEGKVARDDVKVAVGRRCQPQDRRTAEIGVVNPYNDRFPVVAVAQTGGWLIFGPVPASILVLQMMLEGKGKPYQEYINP